MDDISAKAKTNDRMQNRLKKAIQKRRRACLWTPEDAINFIPYVHNTIYGDGRVLYALTTINNRPAHWVIRGDSHWELGSDDSRSFHDFSDEILTSLEEEFGNARCGYSGADLYLPRKDRGCDCEECSDPRRAKWPMVDGQGGCSWWKINWPAGFRVDPLKPWLLSVTRGRQKL